MEKDRNATRKPAHKKPSSPSRQNKLTDASHMPAWEAVRNQILSNLTIPLERSIVYSVAIETFQALSTLQLGLMAIEQAMRDLCALHDNAQQVVADQLGLEIAPSGTPATLQDIIGFTNGLVRKLMSSSPHLSSLPPELITNLQVHSKE